MNRFNSREKPHSRPSSVSHPGTSRAISLEEQQEAINEILEFLVLTSFPRKITNGLVTPNLRDITEIFNHIMSHLDVKFIPEKNTFDQFFIKTMQSFGCPITIKKSHLQCPGSAHASGPIMCSLNWLVQHILFIKKIEENLVEKLESDLELNVKSAHMDFHTENYFFQNCNNTQFNEENVIARYQQKIQSIFVKNFYNSQNFHDEPMNSAMKLEDCLKMSIVDLQEFLKKLNSNIQDVQENELVSKQAIKSKLLLTLENYNHENHKFKQQVDLLEREFAERNHELMLLESDLAERRDFHSKLRDKWLSLNPEIHQKVLNFTNLKEVHIPHHEDLLSNLRLQLFKPETDWAKLVASSYEKNQALKFALYKMNETLPVSDRFQINLENNNRDLDLVIRIKDDLEKCLNKYKTITNESLKKKADLLKEIADLETEKVDLTRQLKMQSTILEQKNTTLQVWFDEFAKQEEKKSDRERARLKNDIAFRSTEQTLIQEIKAKEAELKAQKNEITKEIIFNENELSKWTCLMDKEIERAKSVENELETKWKPMLSELNKITVKHQQLTNSLETAIEFDKKELSGFEKLLEALQSMQNDFACEKELMD